MKWKVLNIVILSACMSIAIAPAHAAKKTTERFFSDFSIGLGYDSNVYLTPKASYIDLGQAGNPLVTPNVQSGLYIPLALEAGYMTTSGITSKYKFDGAFYMNSTLSNANTYNHNITLGKNITFDSGSELYVGLLAGYHKKIYYDRDTGEAKLSRTSGTNISNRYTHFDFGGEAIFQKQINNVKYELNSKLATLVYNDPIVIAPLDHNLLELGVNARFPVFGQTTKLKLGYDFTARDYTNRRARDASGAQRAANALLTYFYHDLNAQLSWKVSNNLKAFLDVQHVYRIDNFVNYNNYTKDKVKFRLRYKLSPDAFLRAKVSYSHRKYPNAFAFDNPIAAKKKYDTLTASLKGEYRISSLGAPALWGKISYLKQDSSDLRYVYNRMKVAAGGSWKY